MRIDREVVDLAKQTARRKLEPLKGTGTRTGNFEIYIVVKKDVQNTLNEQNYSLSEAELRHVMLDAMVETGRFQTGSAKTEVRFFRIRQVVLAVVLVALWIIALNLGNDPSNLRFLAYFVFTVASFGLLYVIFSTNKMIKSFRRSNIIGE